MSEPTIPAPMFTSDVAKATRYSVQYIRKGRMTGCLPIPFFRLGGGLRGRVCYRASDVAAFIATRPTFTNTTQETEAAWISNATNRSRSKA